MTKHPEHEEKNTASDSRRTSDRNKTGEEAIPAGKAAQLLLKLKSLANYALVVSLVLAIAALVVAVNTVNDNQSSQMQLGLTTSKLESMSATLLAYKGELENLKLAEEQRKYSQDEERRQHEEIESEVIRNVTNLQLKLRIYPTLEEQLSKYSSAVPVSQAASSVAPVKNVK
jgi:hypothetical protein